MPVFQFQVLVHLPTTPITVVAEIILSLRVKSVSIVFVCFFNPWRLSKGYIVWVKHWLSHSAAVAGVTTEVRGNLHALTRWFLHGRNFNLQEHTGPGVLDLQYRRQIIFSGCESLRAAGLCCVSALPEPALLPTPLCRLTNAFRHLRSPTCLRPSLLTLNEPLTALASWH